MMQNSQDFMQTQLERRSLLSGALLSGAGLFCLAACVPAKVPEAEASGKLADLEKASRGKLGAYILDTASGKSTGHRCDELFGMCSTFKLALAAAVFRAAEKGALNLQEFVPYGEADMQNYAPVTRENLAKGGMTIDALAEATQVTSDNTAANLLITKLGGPAGVTRFFRDIGDKVTRLDRMEPAMNLVPEGEVRDTTSPRAMAETMQSILLGDELTPAHRETLIQRMVGTKTGMRRIRAGLPESWTSGDKTGTGIGGDMNNKTNDIAIFWPGVSSSAPRSPVIVTGYYVTDGQYDKMRAEDEAVLAELGRIAAAQAMEWREDLI